MVGVEIANAPKLVGISLVGIESFQNNDLVGLNPGGFVDGPRVQAPEPEVALGSDHVEGRCLVDGIKAIEVQISSVDDIESSRFEDQLIEDLDIVNLAVGNNDEGWNASSEVQQRMQFHGAFVSSELGPGEKREAEIDGGGIQSIGGLIQFDPEGIVGVEVARLADENLCKVGVDSPISDLVGMSERIARNVASKTHVIEFPLSRAQTSFDVPEAFPIGQLSESHAEKLVPARKVFDLVVAVVTLNTFLKLVNG